jgi:hypothetical protein
MNKDCTGWGDKEERRDRIESYEKELKMTIRARDVLQRDMGSVGCQSLRDSVFYRNIIGNLSIGVRQIESKLKMLKKIG